MARGWLFLLLLVTTLFTSSEVMAANAACKNPRVAADSVFRWQASKRYDLGKASTCLERTGRSPSQLRESAKRIKLVYDAFGAWIVMEKISDDPNYEDEDKLHLVVPHDELPDIIIEKKSGDWVWTKESLDRIDAYYQDVGALIRIASRLPRFFHEVTVLGVKLWQLLSLLLLVIVGLMVRKLIAVVVAPRLIQLAEKLENTWPEKVVDVIASPGATLVTAIILRVGYPQLMMPVSWSMALAATVRVLITISVVWAIYRAADVLAAFLSDRADATDSKLDDQLVPLLRKTIKVAVCVVGIIVVLQNLAIDVTTLVAGASIATFALSFAAKDTLANLFGSISIFLDAPFQIGDWIHIDGVDGTVEEVGFRSTRIRTFYNSVVVIPNANVANTKIDNYGKREFRRCNTTLGLTYDSTPQQVQAFVEGVRAIIVSNPYTRKDVYEVHMVGFGDSSLDVMLYFFFKCDTWTEELRERHNIYLRILQLAADLEVEFAFPTQSLHVESVATPTPPKTSPVPGRQQLRDVVHDYGKETDSKVPHHLLITDDGVVASSMTDKPMEADG